jgi:hypothetical protein
MSVSFVLKLAPEPLGRHEIAGWVEAVATGEQAAIRTLEELAGFLYDHASASPVIVSPPERGQ